MDKNVIRARFENLGDEFDANAKTFKIDIMKFAHELYKDVNQAEPQSVHITEVTLTAN